MAAYFKGSAEADNEEVADAVFILQQMDLAYLDWFREKNKPNNTPKKGRER